MSEALKKATELFMNALVSEIFEKFDGKIVGKDFSVEDCVKILVEMPDDSVPAAPVKKVKKGGSKKCPNILEPKIVKNTIKNKKSTAKKDEDIRVQNICDHVNNDTNLGKKIKEAHYKEICNKEISYFEKVGGLGDHFDIKINYIDKTKKQCEEKGTNKYHENINESTKPWENSVEFYNGPAEKFSISKKYLKIWYDINVNNNEIKTKYNLPDIPTFENWLNGSPYCMLNPKIEYSKVLKSTFKELYNGDYMCSYKKCNTDIDYRIKVKKKFNEEFNEEDEKLLIKEVQEIYTEVMNQKECWLQTTGNPQTNKFSFKWYKKIESKKIIKVEIIDNPDILFKFTLEDNTSFNGHMRWGKGCGFSCFRIDLK